MNFCESRYYSNALLMIFRCRKPGNAVNIEFSPACGKTCGKLIRQLLYKPDFSHLYLRLLPYKMMYEIDTDDLLFCVQSGKCLSAFTGCVCIQIRISANSR